jgi:hypothetical protein
MDGFIRIKLRLPESRKCSAFLPATTVDVEPPDSVEKASLNGFAIFGAADFNDPPPTNHRPVEE